MRAHLCLSFIFWTFGVHTLNNSFFDDIDTVSVNFDLQTEESSLTATENSFVEKDDYLQKVHKVTNCWDVPLKLKVSQKEDVWIFNNFVKATKKIRCYESITYTAAATYTYLDRLPGLMERWKGPISLALYAPDYDFLLTIRSIAYLRNCQSSLIKEYVTFHLYFLQHQFFPVNEDTNLLSIYEDNFNCSEQPPYSSIEYYSTTKSNSFFPINMGRNIAKDNVQTHFILSADIELYPSQDLIEDFLKMVVIKEHIFAAGNRNVYVTPVFEIDEMEEVPWDKIALKELFDRGKARKFHAQLCPKCHSPLHEDSWLEQKKSQTLDFFETSSGKGGTKELFYVAAKKDVPLFEEWLERKHQWNRIPQTYILCLLDFHFIILNNAFLVYKSTDNVESYPKNYSYVSSEDAKYIEEDMINNLNSIFGRREGCEPTR